jgi:hypothetical protein
MDTKDATPEGVASNEGLGVSELDWDCLLFSVMTAGIEAKLRRGKALTSAQQVVKDSAPRGFKWPERA